MSRHLTSEDRFWAKVKRAADDECWLWQDAVRTDGYGVIQSSRGRIEAAHRVAYTLAYGDIPDGLWVLHRCDVKRCVNPQHLFLGTRQDNMDDMVAKRRHWAHRGADVALKGEANGNARLTAEQVTRIRERHASGESAAGIARDFPVSPRMVANIVQRKNWKSVP